MAGKDKKSMTTGSGATAKVGSASASTPAQPDLAADPRPEITAEQAKANIDTAQANAATVTNTAAANAKTSGDSAADTLQPEKSLSPSDKTVNAQSVLADSPQFRPGIEPRKSPKARPWLFIIGLLLLVAGGLAVREVLVLTDTVSGPRWFTEPLKWLANPRWMDPFIFAAGIAIVIGLIIFIAVLSPRSKTHVAIDDEASVWVRPVDIARMCSSRVEKVHGVLGAHTVATRKKITVTARGKVSDPTIEGRVREAVLPVVEFLGDQHDLKVKVVSGRND